MDQTIDGRTSPREILMTSQQRPVSIAPLFLFAILAACGKESLGSNSSLDSSATTDGAPGGGGGPAGADAGSAPEAGACSDERPVCVASCDPGFTDYFGSGCVNGQWQ